MGEPRERPILMSGGMVRALLEGRKTQTRRVVAGQRALAPGVTQFPLGGLAGWVANDSAVREEATRLLPRIERGDRLWVRETFHSCPHCPQHPGMASLGPQWHVAVYYAAGGYRIGDVKDDKDARPLTPKCAAHGWRPSIHMPRWASRITLAVTSVRVERLQGISEEDARAEGVTLCDHVQTHAATRARAFACLWDSINGKRKGFAWSDNPFVWVVGFERRT